MIQKTFTILKKPSFFGISKSFALPREKLLTVASIFTKSIIELDFVKLEFIAPVADELELVKLNSIEEEHLGEN